MTEVRFSSRMLRRFSESIADELGPDQFNVVLALSKLPASWANSDSLLKMDPQESAQAYASLQSAMRTYYGRGARGTLTRVGQRMWNHLLEDGSLGRRAQAFLVQRLPLSIRRKPALEMLAAWLGADPGDITVHTLDLDLLLADHTSPATNGNPASAPICFVTQGLIRECLFWATGQTFDVQETSCKATGEEACEFTITSGGL